MPEYRGVRDFRDLEVWQWCRELRRDVEALASTLPRAEQPRLSDQMVRAARSVTANLAEGFGRFHYRESVQSCRMARGSLFELLDHLQVALDNGYLDAKNFVELGSRVNSGVKLVNGFIRYLSKRKNGAGLDRSTDQPVNR